MAPEQKAADRIVTGTVVKLDVKVLEVLSGDQKGRSMAARANGDRTVVGKPFTATPVREMTKSDSTVYKLLPSGTRHAATANCCCDKRSERNTNHRKAGSAGLHGAHGREARWLGGDCSEPSAF